MRGYPSIKGQIFPGVTNWKIQLANQSNPIEFQLIRLDFNYRIQSKINHSKKNVKIQLPLIGVRLSSIVFNCDSFWLQHIMVTLFDNQLQNLVKKIHKQNMYSKINCYQRQSKPIEFSQLLKKCKNSIDIWLPIPIENQSNRLVFDWIRLTRLAIELRFCSIGYPWIF